MITEIATLQTWERQTAAGITERTDGVRTAWAFAKGLEPKRFGHAGRDGQPFFFIILKGVDRERVRAHRSGREIGRVRASPLLCHC